MSLAMVAPNQAETCESDRTGRKRYWIAPEIQGRLIGWLVATSAVTATTVAWLILLLVWGPLSNQLVWAGTDLDPQAFFLHTSLRVLATTGLLVVVFGLVSFFTGLVISHRIAGPLHRMGKVAGEAAKGRYGERIWLRRGDYLHEFAEEFNTMLEEVSKREKAHRRVLSILCDQLTELENAAECGPMGSGELAGRIRESVRTIHGAW